MKKEIRDVIKRLEQYDDENIQQAIELIEKLEELIDEQKDEIREINENFSDYRKYGRCYDERY